MNTHQAMRDLRVLKPIQLSDTWERNVPITFDRYIVHGYEHEILVTSRLMCVSQWFNNWLWWPIKPRSGGTRIWLYATRRDKFLALKNPILQEIAEAGERVNRRLDSDDELISFVVSIRKSVISIQFPNRGDLHQGLAGTRERVIRSFMHELGVLEA